MLIQGAVFERAIEWWEALLGLLYPNICQLCRERPAEKRAGYICQDCSSRHGAVQMITPPFCRRCGLPFEGAITSAFECSNCSDVEFHFEFARAAVAAKGLVLEVIHRYKYNRAMWFEPFLANLLVGQARSTLAPADWDLIVPIPLHPVKQREREFNQAERLAKHLSAATGIPIDRRLVRRTLATRTQTRLTREERAINMEGAFATRPRRELRGERIILLDDVFTTGATCNSCAKVLRRNGSGAVCVWTVARGL